MSIKFDRLSGKIPASINKINAKHDCYKFDLMLAGCYRGVAWCYIVVLGQPARMETVVCLLLCWKGVQELYNFRIIN